MIYENSVSERRAGAFRMPRYQDLDFKIKKNAQRELLPRLPEVSELEVIRNITCASQRNYAIDSNFYPLGSCTMKYNPRVAHHIAMLPGALNLHPLSDYKNSQHLLAIMYHLQQLLLDITGMHKVSLAPMAGAQGEFAGVAMIKAYHHARQDYQRDEMLIPSAAHGTNPASAAQCGFKVKEVAITDNGDLNIDQLSSILSCRTAGIMLTNPSTLGIFERQILTIADLVHKAGGILYYDGANLNALLGEYKPFDMGFDVMHINLHKTFATPHGGGGPGSGPVLANRKLAPYLPIPQVACNDGYYYLQDEKDYVNTIGRLSAFHGNFSVLLRAYVYLRMLGESGVRRVGKFATLNANYLMSCLSELGYTIAFSKRCAAHEFIVTIKPLTKLYNITALDVAKRLLDYGFYAPTVYFPLLIPECLLIEPTETESKQMLDKFVAVMATILQEIKESPDLLRQAPHNLAISRVDEVKAARELDLRLNFL